MHELRVYFTAFKSVLMTKLEYRGDFVVGMGTAVMMQLAALVFLDIVLQGQHELAGWLVPEIVMLFGITGMVLGLSELLFNHIWYVPWYVVTGQLDRLMLYPVHGLPFLLVTSPELHSFGNFLTGLALVCWSFAHLHLPWWVAPLIAIWVICGTLIYTAMVTICTSFSFAFLGTKNNLPMLAYHLLMANRYPLSLFPWAVRWALLVVVPYGAFSYVPLQWVLHGRSCWAGIVAPPLGALGSTVAAWFAWERGLRSYESTGT